MARVAYAWQAAIVFGMCICGTAIAQPSIKRGHQIRLAEAQSLLAEQKMKLDEIARGLFPRLENLQHEGQSASWELCSVSLESAMGSARDHLDFLMSLDGLAGSVGTLDDERVIEDEISSRSLSTKHAVGMVGIWVNSKDLACYEDQYFPALQKWSEDTQALLVAAGQSADEMRK